MRSTRGRGRIRVIFSRKNSEKGLSIFHKNFGKDYNIWKKFQIGTVILMAQMKKQKKTELIDYVDLVWTKSPQFLENGSHFFPKQPSKSYVGDLYQPQKFRKGSYFFVKNPRRDRCSGYKVVHPRAKIS